MRLTIREQLDLLDRLDQGCRNVGGKVGKTRLGEKIYLCCGTPVENHR